MRRMEDKGQVSAEYLFLILVILIILSAVTIPLVGRAIDASNDVSWASDAKIAVDAIANAANVVYANGPGAKRTLDVYIPRNTNLIVVNGTIIGLNITLTNETRFINATTDYALNNTTIPVTEGWHKVQIKWTVGTNYIGVTIS